MTQIQPIKIIILDDDETSRLHIATGLENFSYEIFAESNPYKALDAIISGRVDAALIDFIMPECDGLSVLEGITKKIQYFPAILLTGYGSTTLAVEWMKKGGSDYVEKPIGNFQLLDLKIRLAISLAQEKALKNKMKRFELSREFLEPSVKQLHDNVSAIKSIIHASLDTEYGEKLSVIDEDVRQIGEIVQKMHTLI